MTESLDTKPLVEIENLTVRFADSGPPRVNAISLVIHRGNAWRWSVNPVRAKA
jgi:ABC-type glutathione transport system ATPase component